MISVTGCPVSSQFTVDFCTSCNSVFVFFQQQNAAAFAQNKAAPVFVERRGSLCRVSFFGEGFHGLESADGKFINRRFCTAAQADIQITVLDFPECFADGMGGRSTGSYGTVIIAPEVGLHGNLTASHVGNHHWNEERRNPVRTFFQIDAVLSLGHFQTANTAADNDTAAIRVKVFEVRAAVFQCFLGSNNSKLGKAFHVTDVFLVQMCSRVKIPYDTSNADFNFCGIKCINGRDAELALLDVVPERFQIAAERVHSSHTSNDNSFHKKSFLRQRCCQIMMMVMVLVE